MGPEVNALTRPLSVALRDARPALLPSHVDALIVEFDRQVNTLLSKGFPKLARLSKKSFVELLNPLRDRLEMVAADADAPNNGALNTDAADIGPYEVDIPFVIVVRADLVAPDAAISLVELRGKTGFTSMEADDIARFTATEDVDVPDDLVYLATGVKTGRDTLNVTPEKALPTILADGRSPLTLDEGVAVITHFPEVLRTHNCFSLLGSRAGDRRVTAVWVAKGGLPRLGWCYAGAPHTWLGSASCSDRLTASRVST
jgi:hypothetical protein